MHPETIVALSSGQPPAGVAVLRVSGPASRDCVERLAGPVPTGRRASYRAIRDAGGAIIDRGIVLFFESPHSVTGEDMAEFHLHGGKAVVAACLRALCAGKGVRLARAGEFTRRAFDSGRIDLTEAEGLADLIAAETEAQRRLALAQSDGALRALYEGWMERLTHARAMLEASFDFSDEADVGAEADADVRADLAGLAVDMRAHLAGARRGEILRDGYRVALAGPPNAGKSSLLNALCEREVAIVTPVPGTTRDVIEARLDLGGFPVIVFDTAGLRETGDAVEAIGVERALDAIGAADLVLLLTAADQPGGHALASTHVKKLRREGRSPLPDAPRARQLLRLLSKCDLRGKVPTDDRDRIDHAVSAVTGAGIGELTRRIAGFAAEAGGDPRDPIPVRLRHREAVAETLALLDRIAAAPTLAPEVTAETLRQASDALGLLTGRVGVEQLLDVIFSKFCIGK